MTPTGAGTNDYLDAVNCITVSNCWAVGYFNETAYSSANGALIEHSSPSGTWSIVAGPTTLSNMVLSGIACPSASSCWAVGTYTNSSGYKQTLIEQYNGTAWAIATSPNMGTSYNNVLSGVTCVNSSDCWAVGNADYANCPYPNGQTLIEQFNGSSWAIVSSPNAPGSGTCNSSLLYSVSCSAASSCVAVGQNDTWSYPSGGGFSELAELWNGTAWTINSPSDYNDWRIDLTAVSCGSTTSCSAVGYTCECLFGGTIADLWNGSAWSQENVSGPNGWPNNGSQFTTLSDVSCLSASFCATVGSYPYSAGTTVAATWDGSAWTIQSTPNPSGGTNPQLNGVSCVTASACSAVGSYYDGSEEQTLTYTYSGGSWSIQSSANEQGALLGGPVLAPELYGGVNCACADADLAQSYAGDPVDTAYGNYTESSTDLKIPGRGIPLEFTRTYNSLASATNGPLGYGWTSNLLMSLAQPGGSGPVTISQEGGAQVVFDPSGSSYVPAASRVNATLVHNGDGTWTFARRAQDTYIFSSAGQLLSETDRNGYATRLSYNASNQLTTLTDPAGRTLQLGWTGANITTVTDGNVSSTRVVTLQYSSGDLTDVIDVNGGHWHFAYSNHRMTDLFDPNCYAAGASCNGGSGVVTHYNPSGQVDYQVDQLGRKTTFSYAGDPSSAAGGTTMVTDPKGNITQDTYQEGVLTSQTKGYGTASAASWQYRYDQATAVRVATLDPKGNLNTSTADANGNVLSTTDALRRQTSATYNAFNEPLSQTDGNNVTTTYTYDANGNLTSASTPLLGTSPLQHSVTSYTYADSSHPDDVTAMKDPDGKSWTYTYDAYGNQMTSTDPLSNITTVCYNADGWKLASYTPRAGSIICSNPPPSSSYETTYSYVQTNGQTDQFGDAQKITNPLGHATSMAYDADRNLVTETDATGHVTKYTFDLANEQTQVKRGDGSVLKTDYNPDGTVLDEKDGKGDAIVTYGYDTLQRITTVTDADNRTTTYTYDGDGNRLTQQDSGGSCNGSPQTGCTTYGYDAASELTSITYSDGVTPNITNISYDSDGQRTGMTTSAVSSSWSWDSLHRMTSSTEGVTTVRYTYDLKGQLLTLTYPGSLVVTRGYNGSGWLTSVKDWNANTTTFGYNADGGLTKETLPSSSGVVDSFTFNAAESSDLDYGQEGVDHALLSQLRLRRGCDPDQRYLATSVGITRPLHLDRRAVLRGLQQLEWVFIAAKRCRRVQLRLGGQPNW